MRILISMLASICLAAEASAQFDPGAFDAAIRAQRMDDAAKMLDRLVEERRPANGQPVSDPILNARLGRYLQAAGYWDPAEAYLSFADPARLPEAERAPTFLAHGLALEQLGERERALIAFRAAAAAARDGTLDKRNAQLGAARQSIIADPMADRASLLAIAALPNAAQRWEAEYLLAIASSLAGDRAGASLFADRAWSDAVRAPAGEMAPLRVAALRAGLAAAVQDREVERAMLAAANAPMAEPDDSSEARLPVCGDDDVQPSDYVIVAAAVSPFDSKSLVPVAASRAKIVAPFMDRLSGFAPIKAHGWSAAGTVLTLSCRSSISPAYVSKESLRDPLTLWLVERGLYSAPAVDADSVEFINELGRRIDALEARFGKDSLMLVPLRYQLLTALAGLSRAGENVSPGQLVELRTSIATGLRRGGAPQGFADVIEMQTEMDRLTGLAQEGNPDFQGTVTLARKVLMAVPFPLVHAYADEFLSDPTGQFAAARAQVYTALQARPNALTGRERQSWLRAIGEAQKAGGMERESRATFASAGFPSDLCFVIDKGPEMLEQTFSDEDFPRDLIESAQAGLSVLEFGVAANGSVSAPRIIVSMPSALFDQVAIAKAREIRFVPPTRNGKAANCRGLTQRVAWRLPANTEEYQPPPLVSPQQPPETS